MILHALHALKSAPAALARARAGVDRVVVTLTGTDSSANSPVCLNRVLRCCDAVVAFRPDPSAPAAEVIPPGVPPLRGRNRRAAYRWGASETVFLLPTGVRPVKDPTFAFAPLTRLRAQGWKLRLVVAGPSRDDGEMQRLLDWCDRARGWAEYLGELPRRRMGDLYRSVDAVLNTSRAEGLSNAVLEAMACGRAVLASDIPGNRAAVVHGVTGLLFRPDDARDFGAMALRLLERTDFRRHLGRAASRRVHRYFAPEREIDRHLALYARLAVPAGPSRTESAAEMTP